MSLRSEFNISSSKEMCTSLEAYKKVEDTGTTYFEALEKYVLKIVH